MRGWNRKGLCVTFVHLERGSRRVEYSVCVMVQHVAMQEEHRRCWRRFLSCCSAFHVVEDMQCSI